MKKLFYVLILFIAVLILEGCTGNRIEDIDINTYMEYHSIEELVDYWREVGDLSYDAEVLTEELRGDYFFLSWDEAAQMVDKAYARGYYEGATREQEKEERIEESIQFEEEYYAAISNAIENCDINTIYEYTAGSFWPEDFLD